MEIISGRSAPMPAQRPLAVVTGGFGRVGTLLRPALLGSHRLRLVDRVAGETGPGEEAMTADLADPGVADRALAGASALIHLAADARPSATWEEVHRANVAVTAGLLGAAAAHGVPRVVLASTVHAMGEYNRPEHYPVDPAWPPRPCCSYGLSKIVVESMGRLHAERTGASVVALRLGMTGYGASEQRYLGFWLSDGDVRALFTAALTAGPGWSVHFGVSANSRQQWDTGSAARELGYAPADDSERFAGTARPSTGLPARPGDHGRCRMFD
jgi:uronate dehydrogenase